MNIHLRLETPADYFAVENLTREAFWIYTNGGKSIDEHYLVHKLRKCPAFVPELDYVAELDGKLVGNIIFSKATITATNGMEHEILTFGPLSVLPEYQDKGIGQALLRHTIEEAKRLGYKAIVFHGHPDYYPRLGFKRAWEFGLTPDCDACMAMELIPGALNIPGGKHREDPVFFNLPEDEVAAFDKAFTLKAFRPFLPIGFLLDRLEPEARSAIEGLQLDCLRKIGDHSEREVARLSGIDAAALETIRSILHGHGVQWGERKT